MPNWEYKVITSGPLGFASPQLLEQHLNQLGRDAWEIVHFQTRPENPLAFHGLVRRPVARDWSVEAAPAAALTPGAAPMAVPMPPEEKTVEGPSAAELRAAAEERRESLLAREESLRPLRSDEEDADVFEEEELPTFFEAIRPHLHKNQRGPGLATSVDQLARKLEQDEADFAGALKECGFTIPQEANEAPAYLEYDGDLYWLNLNARGQLWINARPKPRPAFRTVPGRKLAAEEIPETEASIPESGNRKPDSEQQEVMPERQSSGQSGIRSPQSEITAQAPLPSGVALLDRLRPMMRRSRRGSGLSGSVSFLARALKTGAAQLEAAFAELGLTQPAGGGEPVFVEIDGFTYWLDRDKNGQTWINCRKGGRKSEVGSPRSEVGSQHAEAGGPQAELLLAATAANSDPRTPHPKPQIASPLSAVRLLLKETKRGGYAAEIGRLAGELGRTGEELLATLTAAGLKVPEKAREKPLFAEHAGEIFWLNRNARGELWLNAKASKYTEKSEDGEDAASKPARRGRRR